MHLIPNTHWDREYRWSFRETQSRLLEAGAILIDTMEKDSRFGYFHFLDNIPCGDLRLSGLDYGRLLANSEVFEKLKDPKSRKWHCAACSFAALCGGCRARAYAQDGDYLAPDPNCGFMARPLR
ncbi:MAG: hypothetical protein JXR97_12410 [Planctomycetes bacterium]|nr:hypothetical protein [Planctomycetota bacterium]